MQTAGLIVFSGHRNGRLLVECPGSSHNTRECVKRCRINLQPKLCAWERVMSGELFVQASRQRFSKSDV